MARKPKLYPQPLRVEAMSTGLPLYVGEPIVDDFTGEAIKPVLVGEPKVLPSAQDLIDEANRAKVAKAKLTLERVGILKPTVSASTPSSRTRLVIKFKPKDWRRI